MENSINAVLWEILQDHLTVSETEWIAEKGEAEPIGRMTAFVAAPRYLSKKTIQPSVAQVMALDKELKGLAVIDWSLVRLARVWLLAGFDTSDQEAYTRHMETLFDTAEMNELVALYSALPLLAAPSKWLHRATDAVRSNMGVVFDAIALQNPYPALHFPEPAWNQLVMKTIFNDKPIHLIQGLDERANGELALIVSDFAHERWAAGRQVPPGVWRLLPRFLTGYFLDDLQQLLLSGHPYNQDAAALVCWHSDYPPAKALLATYPLLEKRVRQQALTWTHLEIIE